MFIGPEFIPFSLTDATFTSTVRKITHLLYQKAPHHLTYPIRIFFRRGFDKCSF